MRTLDDVYGPDLDEFPLEQDAEDWDEDTFNLDWDDDEVQEVSREVVQGR
jgi:2-polyprenyl-3-methyl-5-hydroxy-6-metoxy-1,4-benzoquinol methylase